MPEQSTLAEFGFRLGLLGSAASLAFAAPLANGDFTEAAHTAPSRIGEYYQRGADPLRGFVTNGVDSFHLNPFGFETINGSAGAPSQTFMVDRTTGHYMPGAAQLGVTVNAQDRARWYADGGLEFAQPGTLLGVSNGPSFVQFTSARNGDIGGIIIQNTAGSGASSLILTGGSQAQVGFFNSGYAGFGPIESANQMFLYTQQPGGIAFLIDSGSAPIRFGNYVAEWVRFFNNGGIQVGGPYVAGPGAANISASSFFSYNNGSGSTPAFGWSDGYGMLRSGSNGLQFSTVGVIRMDIFGNGMVSVGFGDDSINGCFGAAELRVGAQTQRYLDVFQNGTGITVIATGNAVTTGLNLESVATTPVRITTNTVERLRIYGDGGVQIGGAYAVSPGAGSLHVTGKLTVDGLIDPTGLALTPVAANPGGALAASTLWSNTGDSNRLYFGATSLTIGGSIASGQVAVGSGANTISGSANLTFAGGVYTLNANAASPQSFAGMAGSFVTFSQANGVRARVVIDSYQNSVAGATSSLTFRSANGTAVAPTAITSGMTLASISLQGYGATGYQANGKDAILALASANWTDASQPYFITFSTVPVGTANTVTERMRIYETGGVHIGVTTNIFDPGSGKLALAGGELQFFATSNIMPVNNTIARISVANSGDVVIAPRTNGGLHNFRVVNGTSPTTLVGDVFIVSNFGSVRAGMTAVNGDISSTIENTSTGVAASASMKSINNGGFNAGLTIYGSGFTGSSSSGFALASTCGIGTDLSTAMLFRISTGGVFSFQSGAVETMRLFGDGGVQIGAAYGASPGVGILNTTVAVKSLNLFASSLNPTSVVVAGAAGQLTTSANLTWVGTTLTVTGKLTVTGLIDPTGLALTPVSVNPGGALAASTVWSNSTDSNKLYFGASAVTNGATIGGTATATHVPFGISANTLTSNSGFTFTAASQLLYVAGGMQIGAAGSPGQNVFKIVEDANNYIQLGMLTASAPFSPYGIVVVSNVQDTLNITSQNSSNTVSAVARMGVISASGSLILNAYPAASNVNIGADSAASSSALYSLGTLFIVTGTNTEHIRLSPASTEAMRVWGDGGVQVGGTFTASPGAGNLYVTGKLTVDGLIDPTGLALTPVAANPGGGLATSTLWVNTGDSNKLYFGATAAGGGGGIGGSIADGQIAFGAGTDITGETDFIWNPTNKQIDIFTNIDAGAGVSVSNDSVGESGTSGYLLSTMAGSFNMRLYGPGVPGTIYGGRNLAGLSRIESASTNMLIDAQSIIELVGQNYISFSLGDLTAPIVNVTTGGVTIGNGTSVSLSVSNLALNGGIIYANELGTLVNASSFAFNGQTAAITLDQSGDCGFSVVNQNQYASTTFALTTDTASVNISSFGSGGSGILYGITLAGISYISGGNDFLLTSGIIRVAISGTGTESHRFTGQGGFRCGGDMNVDPGPGVIDAVNGFVTESGAMTFGDPTADGSWRIRRDTDSGTLIVQKLNLGNWETQYTFPVI